MARMWEVVRRELRNIEGSLPMVWAELGRKVSPKVFSSDAELPDGEHNGNLGGCAAGWCEPSPGELSRLLRYVERRGRTALLDGQEHGIKDPEGEQMRLLPRTLLPGRWVDGTVQWNCCLIRSWNKKST